MKPFQVLVPPDARDDDPRATVIPDTAAFAALAFPMLWFAWHRLWLETIVAAFFAALPALAIVWDVSLVPAMVAQVAFSVFAALEGNARRVADLERKGWRIVSVIREEDAETAFERHVRGLVTTKTDQQPAPVKPVNTVLKRPLATPTATAGLMPLGRDV